MKKITPLFVIMLLVFSCSANDDKFEATCAVGNPIEKLPWLKAEIEIRESNTTDIAEYFYIAQANYRAQTVFVFEDCCPICNTAILVYNCEGEVLGQVHADIARDQIMNSKIIYRPDDFACEMN